MVFFRLLLDQDQLLIISAFKVQQAIHFIPDSGYPYQNLSDDMSHVMVPYEHFEI